jgi:hypothetical protein
VVGVRCSWTASVHVDDELGFLLVTELIPVLFIWLPTVTAGTLADNLIDQDIELRHSTSASVSSPASSENTHSTADADNNNGKECKSKAPPNDSLTRLI